MRELASAIKHGAVLSRGHDIALAHLVKPVKDHAIQRLATPEIVAALGGPKTYTLFALVDGVVVFETIRRQTRERKRISVTPL